jgi:glycosyltransferase involved in cell wall biosynthesis
MGRAMRICLVGGIYGKSADYRALITNSPELILERELVRRGHEISTRPHAAHLEFPQKVDIVHVHHIAQGAVAAATGGGSYKFVITPHATAQAETVPARAVERLAMARADHVIALSYAEATWRSGQFPISDRQTVIMNGADATLFPFAGRQQTLEHTKRFRLLYVGQLVASKRVDVLIRAVAVLRATYPLELSLIYHTASEEETLRNLAADLGMGPHVNFLGPRSPSEVSSALRDASIAVLPSRREALPSVITEALLSGIPIVSTSVGGIPEQLGGFGVLVRPNDVQALASGLREIMEHYEAHARDAEAMRSYALRRFDLSSMTSRHEEVYNALLPGSPRRSGPIRTPANKIVRSIL